MTKKILITGGAGYIGSMLSTLLVKEKFNVTVIDKLEYNKNSLDHLQIEKNFTFIKEDILNLTKIKKIIRNFDIIIPLAALVGAPLCEKNKKKAIDTNYHSIQFLLRNLRKSQKIIYLNTNSGYGVGKKKSYCDENSPLNPISLYGKTKCQAEEEVKLFTNFIVFRLATVFGYSYRMRTDLLVNNFCYKAISEKKLVLFEPHFRRNYIHVKDVCAAILYSIKNFNRLKNQIYNLGLSNANLTKIQLAKEVKKQIKNLKIFIQNNKQDPDQRDYFVSNKKIESKGFRTKYKLQMGIQEMIKIFSNSKIKYFNNY
jgi:nucleoside-diphosphate-sugar epimerase